MSIKKAQERGFTLVELLVVMAILAVLIAISIAGLGYAMRRSRNISRQASIENLQIALEAYYSDEQEYPSGSDIPNGLSDLTPAGLLAPYIESAFDAPPNTEVYYRSNDGQLYTVCTNQEVRNNTNYSFVCTGSGIDSTGYPTREIAEGSGCTDCSGSCSVWDGDGWNGAEVCDGSSGVTAAPPAP